MGGLKSSGPCEDNCEEEINKHIEEIMNTEDNASNQSGDSEMSRSSVQDNLAVKSQETASGASDSQASQSQHQDNS